MIRSIALLATFSLVSVPLTNAQLNLGAARQSKSYVVYAAEPESVPANRAAPLNLRFQIVTGYHINSHTPTTQFLIPTVLTLQPIAGVKTGEPQYPAGQTYSFSFDPGDKLSVYAGSFTVRVPVTATRGSHTLDGSLRYQACDNASCYPPRTVPVKIVFTAK